MTEKKEHSHTEDHSSSNHDDHHDHDHGGVGKYVAVFGALCVLTAMSFVLGSMIQPGDDGQPGMPASIGWTGMMAISCCKALLVILFFMHLKYEANWKYVLTIPASLMSIFLLLMLVPDIGLRTLKYSRERLIHSTPPLQVHHEAHGEDHSGDAHPEGE